MSSTHSSLHYHFVFSTKNRERTLSAHIRARVHEYLGGAIRTLHGVAHAVGGTADHIHIFAGLPPGESPAGVMRSIKSESSVWIKRELGIREFAWQEGYGAFTVSASLIKRVTNYVLNQEEHHRVKSFQEEYLEMLKNGLVEFDDRYLW